MPNWEDANGDTDGVGSWPVLYQRFAPLADFTHHLGCFGNAALQNLFRQFSRNYQFKEDAHSFWQGALQH